MEPRFSRLCAFKRFRHFLQQLTDWQMLWADLLALAAFDAIRRFAVFDGINLMVIVIRVPIAMSFLRVQGREQIGDGIRLGHPSTQ